MDLRRILFATDFSDAAAHAVPAAVEIARRFGAALDVLHVQERLLDVGLLAAGLPPLDAAQDRAAQLQHQLHEWILQQFPPDVPTRALLSEGAAAETIIECARTCGSDLIVMGTHGHSALERFFLGSVTEAVLRKAPCPVLAVPRAGAES